MSRRYPGATSNRFLRDFGADVIKVDPPEAVFPIPNVDAVSDRFGAFWPSDRNKGSIVIHLKNHGGYAVFIKLVWKANVLVEGFRPGITKQPKADYDTLSGVNERLIYCSLYGYGPEGPYESQLGHDANYCALAGALSLVAQKDGTPALTSNLIADNAGAGLHGLIGVLLALLPREKTGKGQFISASYSDAATSPMADQAALHLVTDMVSTRGETADTGRTPWDNVYRCRHGNYISVACFEKHLCERLCRALGREELVDRENPPREQVGEVVSELATEFSKRSHDEWFELLKEANNAVAPVKTVDEVLDDPEVQHNNMLTEFDHPVHGRVRQTGIPIKLSETPGSIRFLGGAD